MKKEQNIIKFLGASVVLILLFSTVAATPISKTKITPMNANDKDAPPSRGYTHTVLTEEGSQTTCGYCPSVMAIMTAIYNSHQCDFYNVALVIDKNNYAYQRAVELGITGTPTVFFDGGYSQIVGAGNPASTYISYINACGARTVANIDLHLDVLWLGSGNLQVTLNVTNNDATTYSGHIRAYVTEINSRYSNTAGGGQYHYAMVGALALNQDVTVPAASTMSYTQTWNGASYGVGDIVKDNIMVIASAFRSGTNYVDETTGSLVRDEIPPQWQNQGQSKQAILRGESINLFAQGKDNYALSWAYLATNETGAWENITGLYGSPINLGGIQNQWVWSNFTWQNPAIPQERVIGWRIYYIDAAGNWNVTDIRSFTILSNPVITDHTGTVTYTGAGGFTFNASIVDDDGVDSAYVEYWYDSGGHTNLTMNPTGVNDFYERTITISSTAKTLHYIISAKDTKNYWSNTGEKTVNIIDIFNPEFQNQGQTAAIIPPGGSITLYAQGRDNIGLHVAWLATNEFGQWLNFSGEGWWNGDWDYSKQIMIHHEQVPSDQTNFPAFITCTSSDFIGHAQPDGDDFVFVDATNTTVYSHEIEYYNSATGELAAWVKIPLLSSTQDTILHLYYGNADCGSQQNVAGTWDSSNIMVNHMTGASSADLKDSSPNHWDITSSGGNPSYNQLGKVGKCVDFDGSGSYLQASGFQLPTDSSYTGGAWVYVDGNAGTRRYAFEGVSANLAISLLVWTNETFKNYAKTTTVTAASYSTTTVNVASPQWYYVSTRVDATNDRLDLFVNGVKEGTSAISGIVNPEIQGLNIGTYRSANMYWMNGKIDEVRISNVPRSDNWIKTEYNNMVSPSTFTSVGEERIRGAGWSYDSPMGLNTNSNEWAWTNFTWQNPAIPEGTQISWRIYYFDATKNVVSTNIMSFLISTQTQVNPPTQPTDITPWNTYAADKNKGIGGYPGKYSGQPCTYQSTSTEAGSDLYFTFYWGDGNSTIVGPVSGSASASFTYGHWGTYSITVTVQHGPSGTPSDPSTAQSVRMFKAGDMNNDDRVTFADIDPFVEALSGHAAWATSHPDRYWFTADCNFNHGVSFADIDPFVARIGD